MNEIIPFLVESKLQYLATIGIDGKPKVRPFQFMFAHKNRLWFCSSNQKEVYRELQQNAFIEICCCNKNLSWLRLSAKVVFDNDLEVKSMILEKSELVKSIYKTPENPSFEVFYLDQAKTTINEIGKPGKTILL